MVGWADAYVGKMRSQVAKDKILEERLRQRMTGQLKSTVKDPFDIKVKKPLITLPPWLEEIAELPSKKDLIRCARAAMRCGVPVRHAAMRSDCPLP